MTAPAELTDPAASPAMALEPGPSTVNPATGLSTDYLNHFTEAIMALEMVRAAPECLHDLRLWQPKTYVEHFQASRFPNRDAIICGYRKASPPLRKAVDQASATLNRRLAGLRRRIIGQSAAASAEARVQRELDTLRPLVARMATLINGTTGQRGLTQSAIDAMFDR